MSGKRQELYEERRRQILDGALQVFSTKGFMAATNKDIAEAAGINSAGLIYHYFENKQALLRAVVEHHAPPMQLLAHADEIMALPPEQVLMQFGQAYLGIMNEPKIGACMRVLMGEAIRSEEFAKILFETGPMRILHLLANYFQRKMEEGVLRQADPQIAAISFIGMLLVHVLRKVVFRVSDAPNIDPASVVSTNVSIFLDGLRKE